MTPKQTLVAHLDAFHKSMHRTKSMTLAQLQKAHARSHHRYAQNHYHAGPNTGPDNRPKGWKTGEAAVPTRPAVVLAEFIDDKGAECVVTRRGDVITTTRTKPRGGTLATFDALIGEVFGS